jgi:hypothetical protein
VARRYLGDPAAGMQRLTGIDLRASAFPAIQALRESPNVPRFR